MRTIAGRSVGPWVVAAALAACGQDPPSGAAAAPDGRSAAPDPARSPLNPSDVAVAMSYERSATKGPLSESGERLTILTAKPLYREDEEIRVIHMHEVTRAGLLIYATGPKEVVGERVDGRPTTPTESAPTPRVGELDAVPSPGVDSNYAVTTYRLAPGRHVIRWSQRTLSSGVELMSNELVVEVR